jgi:hypothetical protein
MGVHHWTPLTLKKQTGIRNYKNQLHFKGLSGCEPGELSDANTVRNPRREHQEMENDVCSTKVYLTQAEVAGKFRVTESTVKNWREKGLLQYLRVPGSTRVLYPVGSVAQLENNSLHQEKEVVKPKEIKRERPEISPKQQKVWRI